MAFTVGFVRYFSSCSMISLESRMTPSTVIRATLLPPKRCHLPSENARPNTSRRPTMTTKLTIRQLRFMPLHSLLCGELVPFQRDAPSVGGVPHGNGRDRAERQSRHKELERH